MTLIKAVARTGWVSTFVPVLVSNTSHTKLSGSGEIATLFLMPTRCPVLFLARVAAVPGGLALRANLEVLQPAHNLAPLVAAILGPLQRLTTKQVELAAWIISPLMQPMPYADQYIRGDVVTLLEPSRRGDPGGLHHVPNLAGVGLVSVHASGE
jgi:hypothetical protein